MPATRDDRADASEIVQWVLGVTAGRATEPCAHDFDLSEAGQQVGGLTVVRARRGPDRLGGTEGSVISILARRQHARSAHLVNDVVEDEAWRKEHLDRITGTPVLQRHLFVWLDDVDHAARRAMEPDVPPERPLSPLAITCLWVARRPAGSAWLADRLWQTDAGGEWETLAPVRSGDRVS